MAIGTALAFHENNVKMSTSPPGILEQRLACCLFLGSYRFILVKMFICIYIYISIHFTYQIMSTLNFIAYHIDHVHTHSQIKSMFIIFIFTHIISFSHPNCLIMALDGTKPTESTTLCLQDIKIEWTLGPCSVVKSIK